MKVPLGHTGEDTTWYAGLGPSERSLAFNRFSTALQPALISNFYGAAMKGEVVQRLNADKMLLGYAAVGRYSDERAPAARGARTSGGGEFEYRFQEHQTVGISAALTYILGDQHLLPILHYAYLANPWYVNLRYPFRGDVRYALNEWVRVGGEISAEGGEYTVGSPEASVDTVRYSAGLAGALLTVGRRQAAQVQFVAGSTLYSRYQALEAGVEVVTLNLKPSAYYQVAGILRL